MEINCSAAERRSMNNLKPWVSSPQRGGELHPKRLKKWTYDYVGYLAQFANNIKIADNLRNIFPHPYTEENARQFIEFYLNKSEEKEVNRAIFYDNQTVGSINLTLGDPTPPEPIDGFEPEMPAAQIDVGIEAAKSVATRKDVIVAMIDTDVDTTHESLQENIVDGWDFFNDDDSVNDEEVVLRSRPRHAPQQYHRRRLRL